MKQRKTAKERRNEILDVANHLFLTKGFEATSTNDIIEEVGIARGTLYYYFKSKEAIMDALIERISVNVLDEAKKNSDDKSVSIFEQMIRVLMTLNINQNQASGNEVIEYIHKPENALMHQKIQKVIVTGVTPILAQLVEDGVEEGLFNTPFPFECIEMLIIYSNTIFDGDMIEMTTEEELSRMRAFTYNAERLLGAETGSFVSIMQVLKKGEKYE